MMMMMMMMMTTTMTRHRGVTLLELTVGVAVMTGIIASAYFCLHTGFASQAALEEHMAQAQKARVLLALMTKDLRHACVWSEDFPFVGMDRTLDGMEADNLDFATHNWSPGAPGEGDICEVSYYVNRSPRTGEVGVWRRRDTSPDPEPTAGGEREELITGVRALRFEYYDGFWWYDTWGRVDPRRELPAEPAAPQSDPTATSLLAGNLYGLPDAVRISIAFGDEPGGAAGTDSARSRASKRRGDAGESATPLVFQTVVHLNLAGRARSSSLPSGDERESGQESTSDGTE